MSGKVERTVDELNSIEPSFSAYRSVTGMPFSAAFFSLDKVYPHMDLPDRVHVDKLESYVSNQLKSRRLNDSSNAASRVIGELQKKLKLTDDHDPFYRLERMSKHIDALNLFEGQRRFARKITHAKST